MQGDLPHRVHQLFLSASQQHRAGQLYDAARLYRRILEMDPRHADALHLLGVVALQRGHHDEAINLIGRAIAENGRVAAFHNNLGNALRARGQLQSAAQAFEQALSLKAAAPDTLFNLAVVWQELGRLDEARSAYERVLLARPDHVAARSNLGNVCSAQGRYTDALDCFDQALRLQPDFVPAVVNRSNILNALGRFEEAVQGYRRAADLNPRFAAAHNNLGLALLQTGHLDEALAAFERAVSIDPRYVDACRNLANGLREQGRVADALTWYGRALAIDPDDAQARLGLSVAAVPVFVESRDEGDAAIPAFEQAVAELALWSARAPGRLGAVVGTTQPFYLAYRPGGLRAPLSRYGDVVSEAAAAHWGPHAGDGAGNDRVRLVVVSGHVHSQHPVWEVLLRGLLMHLNRERLEVLLYHTGSREDDETRWAKSQVDRFVQGPMPTADWVSQAGRDQPDIVFYPEIGMDPVTCALAAIRLAPVQVASWGHPVTTGLPTIDTYLSGELIETPQSDAHYRECLVRLPGTGACTPAPSDTVQTWGTAREGHGVRFALPHAPTKFDPADDRLLVQIAKAVGPCEFWFVSPARLRWAAGKLRTRLARTFLAEGLDPDTYLRETPWLPREQFRGFLDAMDVYLDCPAFSGYTTAWEAVHRGLPIVTREGEFMRQRLASGLLRRLDVTEGIASSPEDYVKRAAWLAQESRDDARRAARRVALRHAARGAAEDRAVTAALERVLMGLAGRQAG